MSADGNTSRPWLLLDRDDTILDDPGYLSDPLGIVFLSGAVEGLRRFSQAGWPLVVVTNQSGVGRGYFGEQEVQSVHQRLQDLLSSEGVQLAGVFYCPHAPSDGCECRKPAPGLALSASRKLNLALCDAVVVGDRASDIELGKAISASYVAQIVCKAEPDARADGHFQSLSELAEHLLVKEKKTGFN